jgi:hypothetical protein
MTQEDSVLEGVIHSMVAKQIEARKQSMSSRRVTLNVPGDEVQEEDGEL